MILRHLRAKGTPYLGTKLARRTGADKALTEPKVRVNAHTGYDEELRPRKRPTAGGQSLVGKLNLLPYYDDRTGETQAHRDAYKKMIREPSIKAALLSKCLAVASLDLTVTPDDPDSDREQDVAEFVRWSLLNVGHGIPGQTVGIPHLVENITLPKLIDGYVLAHKRFEPLERGRYGNKNRLRTVTAKPPESYTFGLDEYNQPVVVHGRMWNNAEEFPLDEFVYARYMPLYDNPLGMSDLRAAYRAYWLLDTVWKMRAIFQEKYGIGFLKGTYANPDDREGLEDALRNSRGATFLTVPEGTLVDAIDIASRGEADYASAIRDLQHEVALGIQGAFLQGGEGSTTGSFAMGKVHMSTSELFVWYLAANLAGDINGQIVPNLVDLNYWEIPAYPTVSFGGVNDADLKSAAEIDEILSRLGYELSRKDLQQRYNRPWAAGPEDKITAPVSAMGMQPGQQPEAQSGANPLLNTVGGTQSITAVQQAYGSGELSREMALANAMLVFGVPRFDAEKLFPKLPPQGLKPQEQAALKPAGGPAPRPFDGGSAKKFADDVPIEGVAADEIKKLLAVTEKAGVDALNAICRDAVQRLVDSGDWKKAKRLFDLDQLNELAESLAATNATANLLGRYRIRKLLESNGAAKFADVPLNPVRPPIAPLPPEQALDYFRNLMPGITGDPGTFGPYFRRQALTLAVTTEATVLKAVQDVIAENLATGGGQPIADIQDILDAAGVSPRNPQYAEAVYRTNAMTSYTIGHEQERQDPDVIDAFPVFRWDSAQDDRVRPTHAERNGKYYPASTTFQQVRGDEPGEVVNCRCVPTPVWKGDWERLQANGATMEETW